jgi:hypothetical protein
MGCNLVLCANPFCIIIVRDGLVYFQRPGEPDKLVTTSKEESDTFLESARWMREARRVVDEQGNFAPPIPEGIHHPMLRETQLSNGEWVWEMLSQEL